jgi:acetolactate synthase-1/2/3 large subunit
VLATSGPGATNLVTGIATAYMDSVPAGRLHGQCPHHIALGKDSFQEAYIEGITMPVTKHNYTVRRVEDLADTMRSAFRIAQSGRKGPGARRHPEGRDHGREMRVHPCRRPS